MDYIHTSRVAPKKWGLHFAIPVFLFAVGLALCAALFFAAVKPQLAFMGIFYVKNPAASQAVSQTASAVSVGSPSEAAKLQVGQTFGQLTVASAGISGTQVLVGNNDDSLANGIGLDILGQYPGDGGKVILCGRSNSFFSGLRKVAKGDAVSLKTGYGTFQYKVSDIQVVQKPNVDLRMRDDSHEYLVMYTDYPFDTIGTRSAYYVVTAAYTGKE